jgi:hypothetical protein
LGLFYMAAAEASQRLKQERPANHNEHRSR